MKGNRLMTPQGGAEMRSMRVCE